MNWKYRAPEGHPSMTISWEPRRQRTDQQESFSTFNTFMNRVFKFERQKKRKRRMVCFVSVASIEFHSRCESSCDCKKQSCRANSVQPTANPPRPFRRRDNPIKTPLQYTLDSRPTRPQCGAHTSSRPSFSKMQSLRLLSCRASWQGSIICELRAIFQDSTVKNHRNFTSNYAESHRDQMNALPIDLRLWTLLKFNPENCPPSPACINGRKMSRGHARNLC